MAVAAYLGILVAFTAVAVILYKGFRAVGLI
ncbi:cytochrome b6-f complex subunit PetL [Spirulina sp. CS-785/01]